MENDMREHLLCFLIMTIEFLLHGPSFFSFFPIPLLRDTYGCC